MAAEVWVCLYPLSESLKAAQKPLWAKKIGCKKMLTQPPTWPFKIPEKGFTLALKTPSALFSNIFNNAKKRVLFIQISSPLQMSTLLGRTAKTAWSFHDQSHTADRSTLEQDCQ